MLFESKDVRLENGDREFRAGEEWRTLEGWVAAWPSASEASETEEAALRGFDTFWYTWAATNEGTTLLGLPNASPSSTP